MSLDAFDRDIKVLAGRLKLISTREGPRAVSSALNKSGAKIRTIVVKETSKETKVPQKMIRKKAFIRSSTARTQKTTISLYRTGVALISLATGKNSIQTPAPGYIAIKGFFVQRGFINKLRRTGKRQVFQRRTQKRMPIDVVKVAIYHAVDKVMPKATKSVMDADFGKLLKHELEHRIRRHGG